MRLACVGVLEHALRLLRLACVGVLEPALRLLACVGVLEHALRLLMAGSGSEVIGVTAHSS